MRQALLIGVSLVALGLLSGCATMTKSYEERTAKYDQIIDTDFRQLADDWDKLWLADRQYRLTRWHLN